MYRLFNKNLNYYENIAYSIQKSMQELQTWIDNKFAYYDSRLEDVNSQMKALVALVNSVKSDLKIQGFAWAYPGKVITPSGYQEKNGIYLALRGGVGSYGVQDLNFYCSLGNPSKIAGQMHDHNSLFVLACKFWDFS